MPDCTEIRPWLVDHMKGRSDRMQEKIERHLDGCDGCREWATFLDIMGEETGMDGSGARLGFDRKLDQIAYHAESRVVPGRYQRRFVVALIGWTSVAILLAGGFLPSVHDSITWLGGLKLTDLATGGLITTGILIISSPLLILRTDHRTEES